MLLTRYLVCGFFFLLLLSARAQAVAETLYLEIVVNGKNTHQVMEVQHQDGRWLMYRHDVVALGVIVPATDEEFFSLSDTAGIYVEYNAALQQLLLQFPNHFFPLKTFDQQRAGRHLPTVRDAGLFINYNLLGVRTGDAYHYANLWHEANGFGENMHWVSTGIYQQGLNRGQVSGYTRFDSYMQWDNEDNLWTLGLGDVINAAPSWGRSVRMGGIRIARDFDLDPGLITYPLPAFFGESAVPSEVDLLINGNSYRREQVDAGPFVMSAIPYFSGAGSAEIITRDAQGRVVRKNLDFYVSSQLLAANNLDYDLSFGFRRQQYGIASSSYEQRPVFSGSLRYGANNYFTPQWHVQSGEGLSLGGAGAHFRLGNFGVLEAAYSRSHYGDDEGRQSLWGYSYARRWLGFSLRHTRRYQNYYDLGSLQQGAVNDRQWQVGLSLYSQTLGSLGANYFRLQDAHLETRSFVSLVWNRYFSSGISTYIHMSNQFYGERDKVLGFSLSIPLGYSGQASASSNRDHQHQWRNQLQAMRNAPYEGGVGWRVGIDDAAQPNAYGALDYRAETYDASAAFYRQSDEFLYQADIGGALVMMDSEWYWGRRVTDAFAVVDAGQANVPVLLGNKLLGHTNAKGKLLASDLYSYQENRLAIDPANLPVNVQLSSVEQRVVPARKSGVSLHFLVTYTQPVLLVVRDELHQPLPVGAQLHARRTGDIYPVGWNGEVYIDDLREPLELLWEEKSCVVYVPLNTLSNDSFPRLGPLLCERPQPAEH